MIHERYSRNINAISIDEQTSLFEKSVAIIGCGGLGQQVASQLCRMGVGRLVIVDFDKFEESNLNRQIFSHSLNIGESKVSETKEALNLINPNVIIYEFVEKFQQENSEKILKNIDIVVDALDNISDRLLLNDICREMDIPLVTAAIGGWYGHVAVIRPGEETMSKIFSNPAVIGIETELGNPAFIPSIIASIQVSEVIKYLTVKPTIPEGKVLYVDLLKNEYFLY
jgi:molybdopterin/thiamine biosynthesis adenylyltransferase